MRTLILTLASLAAAGAANASSIEIVTSGRDSNGSISTISCAHCPPPSVRKRTTYIVPDIAPGTARMEVKEINGEMKLVRTEAWLGGSPVTFVTKASEEAVAVSYTHLTLPTTPYV